MMPQVTMQWQAYVLTVQCNCIGPDTSVQANCPIHAYNMGHFPGIVACNLVSPNAITKRLGCSCRPLLPSEVAAWAASGGIPLVAATSAA